MGFEQALIKVEKEKEFEELKGAINRAFAPENAGKYLKRVASAGLRIRDFGCGLPLRSRPQNASTLEPMIRIELMTSPLPRECSTN